MGVYHGCSLTSELSQSGLHGGEEALNITGANFKGIFFLLKLSYAGSEDRSPRFTGKSDVTLVGGSLFDSLGKANSARGRHPLVET